MSNIKATDGQQQLTLVRIFNVPREVVFKAWTDQKQVAKWWGPRDFTNPICALDVRPGGFIHIDMAGPDGIVYPMKGVFHEIVEPERLMFTTSALEKEGVANLENLINVTFDNYNSQTRLILNVVIVKATPEAAKSVAGMEAGWSQSLDRLNQLIASV